MAVLVVHYYSAYIQFPTKNYYTWLVDTGGRDLSNLSRERVQMLENSTPGRLKNIDTPEEYKKINSWNPKLVRENVTHTQGLVI